MKQKLKNRRFIFSPFMYIYMFVSMYTSFVVNSYATCVRNAQYKYMNRMIFMPPFEEKGVYCFAHVGRSVGRSVRPPGGCRMITQERIRLGS